jgi:hypothetical protein
MPEKLWVLFSVGRFEGITRDEAFAKEWDDSNPYYSAKEFTVDSNTEILRARAASERIRLAGKKFSA